MRLASTRTRTSAVRPRLLQAQRQLTPSSCSYDYDFFWDEIAKVSHEPSVCCEGAVDRQERERRNDKLKEFCTTDEPLDDDGTSHRLSAAPFAASR